MQYRNTVITTTGFAALVMAFALFVPGTASSASADKDSHMTFDHPVRVPGATLPAGKYVFQHNQNEHAVWIVSEDDGTVYGPYLTLARYRLKETAKRVIVLDRSSWAGGAPKIRAWFGRFERRGHEFIYTDEGRS